MSMTAEELLKERFMVIADYPNSTFKVKEIVEQVSISEEVVLFDMVFFYKYPHLFRKLEWFEERRIADMPGYVRNKINNILYEVEEFELDETEFTVTAIRVNGLNEYYPIEYFIPANKPVFYYYNH